MDNPRKINFMDDAEAASLGWMAVERDSDGHLIAVCAYPDDAQFFADAAKRGNRAYPLADRPTGRGE